MTKNQECYRKRVKLVSKFSVPGNPFVQKRHKYRMIGNHPQEYDPSLNDKAEWKAAVKRYAPSTPISNKALRVDVMWVFPRPSSHFGSGSNSDKLKPSAPKNYEHFVRPDRDNLDKILLDAMTGVFWKDDAQVAQGFLKKSWGLSPKTIVFIYEL